MVIITFNSSRAESGRITGLNESECGHIGVNNMQGTFGWTCNFLVIRLNQQGKQLKRTVQRIIHLKPDTFTIKLGEACS